MLSVESLSKSFGETQVLKNINLDIPSGETTVILGPSGSGKSTLLRCLNLLETPQSGTLTIDDAQVDYSQKLTDAQVRDIRSRSAMVFQQFNLFPNYTALKNVALAPTLNGTLSAQQAQERARELLADHFGAGVQLQVTVGQTGGQTAAARASEQQARRQAESEEAIKADPFVRTLLEEFGATILPDSIKPLDGEKSS